MTPIEGVTVISTIDNTVNVFYIVFFVILASIIIGVVLQVAFDIDSTNVFRSAIFSAIVFCAIICLYYAINPPQPYYNVVIDDTVSMTEFFDEYEIISIDGDIYTVKEK